MGRPARRPGRRERLGQPHVPPRRRVDRAAAHRRVLRGGRREGRHVAAAPHAPPAVTDPGALALASPGAGYPWPWSVRRWIEGRPATAGRVADPVAFAGDLAGFLVALWGVDAAGGPAAGAHSFHRGGALAVYDEETRAALARSGRGSIGPRRSVSGTRRSASTSAGPPVWFHGDVATGNLLVDATGRLSAVIDFGTCGVGDPACDLVIAWTLFDGVSRAAFVEGVGQDEGTWARARGWALWKALITLAAPDAAPRDVAGAPPHAGPAAHRPLTRPRAAGLVARCAPKRASPEMNLSGIWSCKTPSHAQNPAQRHLSAISKPSRRHGPPGAAAAVGPSCGFRRSGAHGGVAVDGRAERPRNGRHRAHARVHGAGTGR